MSRQWFGSWGADLDDFDFACALAMAGTLDDGEPATKRASLRFRADFAHPGGDARALAEEWKKRFDVDTRVAIEIVPFAADASGLAPDWLVDTLANAANVSSVSFVDWRKPPLLSWDWPLDVGALDGALRDALAGVAWAQFISVVDPLTASAQVDVLLFPGTLGEALAMFAGGLRLPPIHTLLILGGVGRVRDPRAALATVRGEANAAAAGVVDVPIEEANHWLGRVLLELAHDRSLDEALFKAGPRPLLLGCERVFEGSRASRAASSMVEVFARANPEAKASDAVDDQLLQWLAVPPDAPIQALVDALENRGERMPWHSEGGAASEVLKVRHKMKGSRERDDRFLQARVMLDGQRHDPRPLVAGRVHRLEVRIARPAPDWTAAPAAFPAHDLPPNQEGHELTVAFIAPGVLDAPQTTKLWLPPHADSALCTFDFMVRPGIDRLDARVTVLHRNRILQTARLRTDDGKLTIELESVLRANLADVGGSPGFDAAFLFNDVAGERGVSAFTDRGAIYVQLVALEPKIKALRDELEKITKSPGDFADIKSEATRKLFVALARMGANFATSLRELPRMKSVLARDGNPRRIQLMSLHADELVPIELAYDRAFPAATAKLCDAVRDGNACGDHCPNDSETVCPQGFWGLRDTIERRLYDENVAAEIQAKNGTHGFSTESGEGRPSLGALRSVLFGSADKAAAFDKVSFDATVKAIDKALKTAKAKLVTAKTWTDWVDEVKEHHPDLLLLLPHTEPDAGDMVLEIGADKLASGEIQPPHVSEPPPAPPQPGPIVVLLGCRTALDELPFSSFIGAFRRASASVVLATLSTVRGRHMAPVAQTIVDALLARAKGPRANVAELVRDVRKTLLRNGLPVGMTVVAFGDVDWQVGGTA